VHRQFNGIAKHANDLNVIVITATYQKTPLSNIKLILDRLYCVNYKGKALLSAQETAYPALASVLENSSNPIAPHIIIISESADEQAYFDDNVFSHLAPLHEVICSPQTQAFEMQEIIKQFEQIDFVWLAFEADSAKKIRHY